MLLTNKTNLFIALSALTFPLGCSQKQAFKGNVNNAVTAPEQDEEVEEIEEIEEVEEKVDSVSESTTIEVSANRPAEKPMTIDLPSTETFNECGKFTDTQMVAKVSEIEDQKNASGETIMAIKHFPFDLEKFYLGKPKVTATVCLKNLDIGLTSFSKGFPGAETLQEWFALDVNFILVAPESGDYFFTMNSDDGSAINIDGKQLEFRLGTETPRKFLWGMDGHNRAENNGRQGSVADGSTVVVPAVPTEKITLKKGQKYPVRVLYYQGPKFNIMLDLKWQPPSATQPSHIPAAMILKPF